MKENNRHIIGRVWNRLFVREAPRLLMCALAAWILFPCCSTPTDSSATPQNRWTSKDKQEDKDGWTDSLQLHEPLIVGFARDERSTNYLDVRLSFKYLLFDTGKKVTAETDCTAPIKEWQFFGAFSTRFSQYVGTRDSSPVVARRFNPELLARYNEEASFLDIAYGHESNGQSIDSPAEFTAKQTSLAQDEDDTDAALDYVSRGWDYVGAAWDTPIGSRDVDLRANLGVRYFLPRGFFQGSAEDYYAFEPHGNKERRAEYDGVRLSLIHGAESGRYKTTFQIRTGYNNPFRHSSFRIEHTHRWRDIPPLVIWAQTGYNSDLAHYYQRINTAGIGLELSF